MKDNILMNCPKSAASTKLFLIMHNCLIFIGNSDDNPNKRAVRPAQYYKDIYLPNDI